MSKQIDTGELLTSARTASGTLRSNESSTMSDGIDDTIVFVPEESLSGDDVPMFYDLLDRGVEAILCETIERHDHGVILANEFGVPCLSGVNPTVLDYEDDPVCIDGETVRTDDLTSSVSDGRRDEHLSFPETEVSVKVNLGVPEAVDRKPRLPEVTDGVGFMRLEFVLLGILDGVHPERYIDRNGRSALVNSLANRVDPVIEAFDDPVWIRTDDFSPFHLRRMEGGSRYEPEREDTPMGWRGVARSIERGKLYDIELEALTSLLDRGHSDIGLFPPMTRTSDEFHTWREMAVEAGFDGQFGVMVETPSLALSIEEITDEIEFLVFGSNDLTQFTLAVDRNDKRLNSKFDESHESMLKLFKRVIDVAKREEVETTIGGRAATDPELVSHLKSYGIDSLSVNPDLKTVVKTKKMLTSL